MTITDILRTLQEYYGKKLNDTQVRVYVETLNDLPVDLLDMAVKELIKTGHPFLPKVAEIRRAATNIKRTGNYTDDDPLRLIPGSAQTEADLDERYGTIAEHQAICDYFTSGGELPPGWMDTDQGVVRVEREVAYA